MTDQGDEQRDMTRVEMARKFGVNPRQVKYVTERYDIQPCRRVGIIGLWSPEDVERVGRALGQVAERRRGVSYAV